ncbi:MAG TPA: HopJ type III effector protein [Pelobium sp.]
MTDKIQQLIEGAKQKEISFAAVISTIDSLYQHRPTAFKNGDTFNEATQNQGSARVFSFAKLNKLSKESTLWLFAEHYHAVLNNPEGKDHQNIRQFMLHGWAGVEFEN